jgi:uncharacterized protein with HEPN domain
MPRNHRLYLDDIIEAVARIREYTAGMDEKTFGTDLKTQDAVVRNLEVIGEAAGRLPDGTRQAATEIEWRKITDLRNILIHKYFGVNLPIIWDIVQTKLDALDEVCHKLLAK